MSRHRHRSAPASLRKLRGMQGMVSGVLVIAAFAVVAAAAGFVVMRLYRVSRRVRPGAGAAAQESPDA
jgi:hypothetical protein